MERIKMRWGKKKKGSREWHKACQSNGRHWTQATTHKAIQGKAISQFLSTFKSTRLHPRGLGKIWDLLMLMQYSNYLWPLRSAHFCMKHCRRDVQQLGECRPLLKNLAPLVAAKSLNVCPRALLKTWPRQSSFCIISDFSPSLDWQGFSIVCNSFHQVFSVETRRIVCLNNLIACFGPKPRHSS